MQKDLIKFAAKESIDVFFLKTQAMHVFEATQIHSSNDKLSHIIGSIRLYDHVG